MGWTGRAPAPDGTQSAPGACQEKERLQFVHSEITEDELWDALIFAGATLVVLPLYRLGFLVPAPRDDTTPIWGVLRRGGAGCVPLSCPFGSYRSHDAQIRSTSHKNESIETHHHHGPPGTM